MTQITTGTIDFSGEKLYYEMGGEGETLVLCHAGFVDSRMWDDQWAAFTQHYRVIRFDMRGYGKSDRLQAPVSRRDDLLQLLKHLQIERAALLGCSLGAEMVIDFTLDNPDMVSALIVVSGIPSGFEMQGEPPQEILEMMSAAQQGDMERVSELQLRLWIDGPYRQPGQADTTVRQRAAVMNRIVVENGTFAMDAQPIAPLDPPAVGRLNEINIPTLVIAGALDNAEIVWAAKVMKSQIKLAEEVIILETAHLPNMEKPHLFNETVMTFLRKNLI